MTIIPFSGADPSRQTPTGEAAALSVGRNRRDRAPASQERVVVSRSGNLCAYPHCTSNLAIDPNHPDDVAKPTGKVAHIRAASPGGPRYDKAMNSVQRGSADNLIYLCGPHHDAVDSQLSEHTAQFLLEAKQNHEQAVARGVRSALGEVTFEQLALVCQVVGSAPPTHQSVLELALPVREKIELNRLGEGTLERVRDGLAQAVRVREFIEYQNKIMPNFGRSLAARLKSLYFAAVAEGLQADAVFDHIVDVVTTNSGPRDSPQIRAAALSVVAYMFELCEIFDHG